MQKKEVQTKSENKIVQSTIDRDFFLLYCEDRDQLKQSMDELCDLAKNSQDPKVRADCNKYIINQIIGNAKQATQLEGAGDIEITIKSRVLTDEETTDRT